MASPVGARRRSAAPSEARLHTLNDDYDTVDPDRNAPYAFDGAFEVNATPVAVYRRHTEHRIDLDRYE